MGDPGQPRGPDGRWISRGGGTVLLAAGVAVAVAAGSGGVVTGAGGGAGASRPGSSSARSRDPAPVVRRLADRAVDVGRPDVAADDDCAGHSYGAVRRWFEDHPCDALFRGSFVVEAVGGGTVLVAVSWVDMPTDALAREYHALVDGDGTGNVTELTRERGPYTAVRFDGEHYASTRDGVTVVNAQAQPVDGAVGPEELEALARTAVPPT